MLCDLCKKNEAQLFLEVVGKNGRHKINLCLKCAAEHGLNAPVAAPDAGKLSGIFEEIERREMASSTENSRLCPVCGRSFGLIRKTGRTGCPECYEIFKSEINSVLSERKLYYSYTGSMPKRLCSFRNALTDRADLQAKLDEAVRNENYEKAAVYRDFLKALENKSVADGNPVNEGETGTAASTGENPPDERQ